MAEVEASESKELQEFIEFVEYYEHQPPCMTKTWTAETLASGNALLAKQGLADIMEQVVVGGRNAIKFKGPEAAEYLALHEDSNRRTAEYHDSDHWKSMQAMAAQEDAKFKAGLLTDEELERIEAPVKWLRAQYDSETSVDRDNFARSWKSMQEAMLKAEAEANLVATAMLKAEAEANLVATAMLEAEAEANLVATAMLNTSNI
jgi:hypothetical protein